MDCIIASTDAVALLFAPFGQGIGPIWMDNLACLGFEDRLINCTFDPHTADCAHFEDAGLRCQGKLPFIVEVLFVFYTCFFMYMCSLLHW